MLKIAAIQSSLTWEDKKQNLHHFDHLISTLEEAVDLIVLPEMFSTGFTMNPERVAESMEDESVRWMKKTAQQKNSGLVGSIVIKENGKYFNRSLFVHPDGSIDSYDKRHTFTLAGEDRVYEAGTKRTIVNFRGWKICPMICYDLRFPVWIRNVDDYDLLIFMANWPTPRVNAWDQLLKARAIENMSYVVGVNRIGTDDNDYKYSGHSAVIDSLGEVIAEISENQEGIVMASIQKEKQQLIRDKLGFLNDRDQFKIYV